MAALPSSLSALSTPSYDKTPDDESVAVQSTTASSPTQVDSCPYRDARQLPCELKNHCHILLEEQLYTCAIQLLNSIVSSGESKSANKTKPVLVPPPSHIALLNTLVVHPRYTTRTDDPDQLEISSRALDYLRNLAAIAGPINADFRTALQFKMASRNGRRRAQQVSYNCNSTSDESGLDVDGDEDELRGKLGNEKSLWSCGEDFWSTLGWAFNCSALHPQRWRYWKAWLDFMIDVLEEDWNERERRDQEAHREAGNETGHGAASHKWRNESIILMYIDQQSGRQGGIRGIIKALVADGSEISSKVFREVFNTELKGPRKESKKRKRDTVLDLDKGKFGDYFDDESMSSGVSEPPTPQKPKDSRKASAMGLLSPGAVEAMDIRLRLFRLLSEAMNELRRSDLSRLYEEFAAAIKILPLPAFSLYITQRPNQLLMQSHITIARELFHLLLPSLHKSPAKVDREAHARGDLSTPMLEHSYILHAANTVAMEDNAKLSLVVENSIQLLLLGDSLDFSASFAEAAETGIQARETKVKKRRTGKMKTDSVDALALAFMETSAERIRVLMDLVRAGQSSDEE